MAREHPEPDLALHQVVDRIDEMAEVAAKTVELPDDQRDAIAQRLEARVETGAVIFFARRLILVEPGRLHAGASNASRCTRSVTCGAATSTRNWLTPMARRRSYCGDC